MESAPTDALADAGALLLCPVKVSPAFCKFKMIFYNSEVNFGIKSPIGNSFYSVAILFKIKFLLVHGSRR